MWGPSETYSMSTGNGATYWIDAFEWVTDKIPVYGPSLPKYPSKLIIVTIWNPWTVPMWGSIFSPLGPSWGPVGARIQLLAGKQQGQQQQKNLSKKKERSIFLLLR